MKTKDELIQIAASYAHEVVDERIINAMAENRNPAQAKAVLGLLALAYELVDEMQMLPTENTVQHNFRKTLIHKDDIGNLLDGACFADASQFKDEI